MEFILQNQNLIWVASAVISGVLLVVSFLSKSGGKNAVTTTQATLLINREDALIIDVRENNEYVEGHLPEARNIPLGQIEERAGDLEAQKALPLVLVCQTGARSADACKKLEKLGFARAHNLEGGINAWRAAGLPLKKGAKK